MCTVGIYSSLTVCTRQFSVDLYNNPFPSGPYGWFIILVFITSAGVPSVADTIPEQALFIDINVHIKCVDKWNTSGEGIHNPKKGQIKAH